MHLLKGLLLASGGALLIANASLFATGQTVAATPVNAPLNLGSANVCPGGQTTPAPCSQTVTMTFKFTAGGTIAAPSVVTQGAPNLDFTDAGTGTCKADKAYNSGDTCTVNLTFRPRFPGARYGAAELLDGSGNLLATGLVYGTGVGPQATFADSSFGLYFPAARTALGTPFGSVSSVAVDESGNIFFPDQDAKVKEIVAAGGYATTKTVRAICCVGSGIALDGSGNIFISDINVDQVREIVAAGGYTTIKTLATLGGPKGMAVDGSGNLFVADQIDSAVYELLAADGYATVKKIGGGFSFPYFVAVDGSGNVFVTDVYAVKEILAAGGYTTVNTLYSGLGSLAGIGVDASANVYVATNLSSASEVIEIVAAGGYSKVRYLGAGFINPGGLAVDQSGNVIVADSGNHKVIKLDFADSPSLIFEKASVGVESSDSPRSVTVSNNGNAALTFPIPTAGRNPSVPSGFTLDSATSCPDLGISSSAGEVAAGASCVYAVDFIPVSPGTNSGSMTLTDNS